MVEVHPENSKSIRIVATRDSNSIRMEMSRVANVSFITHDDAAATWLPSSRRTVGQIPLKCKESSNMICLSLIWFISVLFFVETYFEQ